MIARTSEKITRISAQKRVEWVNISELWDYRDLFQLIVRRDTTVKYRQTILGPLWLVIQPLMLTLVFSGVFGAVGGLPTDGVPRPLFYLAGLVPWAYFSQVFAQVAGVLHANAHIFSKVYFPRLIIPLSAIASGLVALTIQLLCFSAVRLWYMVNAPETVAFGGWLSFLSLPLALLLLMAFSLGAGLWMSVLTAKYRDLTQLTPFLVQILMYATPLIFPLSSVPEKYRLLASLNPLTVVLESFRSAVFGSSNVTAGLYAVAIGVTAILLVSGLRAFGIVERNVIDSI